MKTIKFFLVSLLTGFILLTACSKDEPDFVSNNSQNEAEYKAEIPGPPVCNNAGWREDFATANSLTSKWNLYGTPQPQWVYFAAKRFGLFDNNGHLPEGNYAVSKTRIGYGKGYTIESEVFIDITKPVSTIISPEIGVTRKLNIPAEPRSIESGISMKLLYVGQGVAEIPAEYKGRTFVVMSALLQNGNFISSRNGEDGTIAEYGEFAFPVDAVKDGWHKMKIVVNSAGQVSFYLDNRFVWSPRLQIHSSLMKGKNVFLGFTSPGNGGKAYHDYVKLSYPLIGETQFCPGETETNE